MRLSEQEFTRVAKALADPQRCEILQRMAATGELCCSAIVADCGVTQATISHHLKELHVAGLIERRKHGRAEAPDARADPNFHQEPMTKEFTSCPP
jgi:ArsR family transcriptional regulator